MVERRLPEGYSNSIISAAQSKNPNLLFAAVEKAVSFLAKTEGHLKGMEFTYDLPRGKIFMKGKFPSGESYACSLVVESTIPCLVVRGKIGFEVSFSSEKLAFPNKVVRAIEESVLNFDKLVAEGAGKP